MCCFSYKRREEREEDARGSVFGGGVLPFEPPTFPHNKRAALCYPPSFVFKFKRLRFKQQTFLIYLGMNMRRCRKDGRLVFPREKKITKEKRIKKNPHKVS